MFSLADAGGISRVMTNTDKMVGGAFLDQNMNRRVATTTRGDRGDKAATNLTLNNAAGSDAPKTRLVIRIPPRRALATAAAVQQERGAQPVVSPAALHWQSSDLTCYRIDLYSKRNKFR